MSSKKSHTFENCPFCFALISSLDRCLNLHPFSSKIKKVAVSGDIFNHVLTLSDSKEPSLWFDSTVSIPLTCLKEAGEKIVLVEFV